MISSRWITKALPFLAVIQPALGQLNHHTAPGEEDVISPIPVCATNQFGVFGSTTNEIINVDYFYELVATDNEGDDISIVQALEKAFVDHLLTTSAFESACSTRNRRLQTSQDIVGISAYPVDEILDGGKSIQSRAKRGSGFLYTNSTFSFAHSGMLGRSSRRSTLLCRGRGTSNLFPCSSSR